MARKQDWRRVLYIRAGMDEVMLRWEVKALGVLGRFGYDLALMRGTVRLMIV